jgi:hypothetical protein
MVSKSPWLWGLQPFCIIKMILLPPALNPEGLNYDYNNLNWPSTAFKIINYNYLFVGHWHLESNSSTPSGGLHFIPLFLMVTAAKQQFISLPLGSGSCRVAIHSATAWR